MTQQELRDEMREDMLADAQEEERLRNDLDYCIDKCAESVLLVERLEAFTNKVNSYGHEMSLREILEYMGEV